jgi:D-glycero-alpha-D-manno-heptose-7-phosphate kinase
MRLGLSGGGTDIDSYSKLYGGFLINATIDKYVHSIISERFDGKVFFHSFDKNIQLIYDVNSIFLDCDSLIIHKVVYLEFIKKYGLKNGGSLNIATFSDAPSGSGLGSSSTLVVSLIIAFLQYYEQILERYEIAKWAWTIEREICGMKGGKQDQYAAAFGGFNQMEFGPKDFVKITPLKLNIRFIKELSDSLVLFYTGTSRNSSAIIFDQEKKITEKNSPSLELFHLLKNDAFQMRDSLLNENLHSFANCLNNGWEIKKKTSNLIFNSDLDNIFEIAKSAGAKAMKISGAGGGGFMLFFIEPAYREKLISELKKLKGQISALNFTFEPANAWQVNE